MDQKTRRGFICANVSFLQKPNFISIFTLPRLQLDPWRNDRIPHPRFDFSGACLDRRYRQAAGASGFRTGRRESVPMDYGQERSSRKRACAFGDRQLTTAKNSEEAGYLEASCALESHTGRGPAGTSSGSARVIHLAAKANRRAWLERKEGRCEAQPHSGRARENCWPTRFGRVARMRRKVTPIASGE
jgi:hypothetical protein